MSAGTILTYDLDLDLPLAAIHERQLRSSLRRSRFRLGDRCFSAQMIARATEFAEREEPGEW